MKIGILGGTFNPIHNSHLYLAQQYRENLSLDKVLLIPTYTPPHKAAYDLAAAQDRLEMCRIATENLPFIEVCDYEIQKEGLSYTYQTLQYLTRRFLGADLYLLMGADMFLTLLSWRNPQEIIRLATLCAAAREQGEYVGLLEQQEKLQQQGARCIVLQIAPKPLSSTQIRERIQRGEEPIESLPPGVWQYILKQRLYLQKETRPS